MRFEAILCKITLTMRTYELVFVIKTSLSEDKRKKLVDSVKSLLTGLKVTKEDDLGQKVFAYPIKRERSGFYVKMVLEGDTMVAGLDKKLSANEDILRHLVIRKK